MKFEAGKTYTYSVTLAAKDGYHFGDSFTATVNGKNATVVHNTDGTITLTDISTVTVPSDPVVVKKIDTVKAANAILHAKPERSRNLRQLSQKEKKDMKLHMSLGVMEQLQFVQTLLIQISHLKPEKYTNTVLHSV